MSNDTNMDNRILAEFMGELKWHVWTKGGYKPHFSTIYNSEEDCLKAMQLYDEAWDRELKETKFARITEYAEPKAVCLKEYHTDRNALHRVWEKFRELRFGDNAVLEIQFLTHYRQCIRAMSTGTLTDLYNALVNAVKWYNKVTPATEAEYEKGKTKN